MVLLQPTMALWLDLILFFTPSVPEDYTYTKLPVAIDSQVSIVCIGQTLDNIVHCWVHVDNDVCD